MKIILIIIQAAAIICIAPLFSGIIRKIKNNLRMRKGAGVLQPYFNLFKLMRKEEVVSARVSWIFTAAPYVALSSATAALLVIPVIDTRLAFSSMGDFMAVIFLLSLGRYFIALAGLDAGSSFGGMGSSREMFISSIAEPAALMAVFAISVKYGSTDIAVINALGNFHVSSAAAAAALFMVMLAETSRIPVDNQETHLELTMIHEAMVLEYSGRSLALIELSNHIKQAVFFILLGNIFFPFVPVSVQAEAGLFLVKMLCLCAVVGVLEVSMAKMRLFRAVDFFSFGFVLSSVALIIAVMGF